MNQTPHTNTAPESHRPNPGQVMRQALIREEVRRHERRQWWLNVMANVATHAMWFVIVVVGVVAITIN